MKIHINMVELGRVRRNIINAISISEKVYTHQSLMTFG